MNIFDPYAHTTVLLRECEVIETDGDFAAVRSRKEGKWFAVHMPTNHSIHLNLLGEDAVRLEEAINRREFADKYLAACQWVRDHDEVLAEDLSEELDNPERVFQPMNEALGTYGKVAVHAAMIEARMRYSSTEIMHAFRHLEESDTVSLSGVETVCISELEGCTNG